MTKDMEKELTDRHWLLLNRSGLLDLIFVTGYDIDWYPLFVKCIGNW